MKTQQHKLIGFLFFALLVLTSVANLQEKKTFVGTYDGNEDYGYNFIGINEDKDEYTITFQKTDDSVLTAFNLKSESLIGTKFTVTYTSKIIVEKDENGYDEETEILTIVDLKKL